MGEQDSEAGNEHEAEMPLELARRLVVLGSAVHAIDLSRLDPTPLVFQ